MRILLDTHALLWLLGDDPRLSDPARNVILDPMNEVFASIASFWEMAVKIRVGKLASLDVAQIMTAVATEGIELLEIRPTHIGALQQLPFYPDHRDPFDHLLVAQAISEGMIFMSEDRNVHRYAVARIACSSGR